MAALVLLFGGAAAVVVQQSLARQTTAPNVAPARAAAEAAAGAKKGTAPATTNATARVLVFRDVPSWNRHPDFEDALSTMGVEHEVKSSAQMGSIDLAPYGVVIIPGAQYKKNFYGQYAAQAGSFERYVTNGGTLVLELNGAENDGITLPRGVSMVSHGSRDNTILVPGHPILIPLGGRAIHANFASHGYLEGVPKDALVLVTETTDGEADQSKPTFVEYAYGAGRVIAACQCFHDQDRSGRGPLMETLITYSMERKWFSPRK
jgi:hypothetical protein